MVLVTFAETKVTRRVEMGSEMGSGMSIEL